MASSGTHSKSSEFEVHVPFLEGEGGGSMGTEQNCETL